MIRMLTVLTPLALTLVACKSNSPEQLQAVEAAADAHCGCVKAQLQRPVDELKNLDGNTCEDAGKAFDAAWKQLSVVEDDKAQALFDLHDTCNREFSDLLVKYAE